MMNYNSVKDMTGSTEDNLTHTKDCVCLTANADVTVDQGSQCVVLSFQMCSAHCLVRK